MTERQATQDERGIVERLRASCNGTHGGRPSPIPCNLCEAADLIAALRAGDKAV